MIIAVVGASGVLGRSLVPMLASAGHTVRALSRHPVAAAANVEPVPFDLLCPDADRTLPDLLAGCQAVAHVATAVPRDLGDPSGWTANTLLRTEGVRRLLCSSLAAGVRHYVQQSITMAYADGGDHWLSEEAPLDTSAARTAICGPVREMEALVTAIPAGAATWSILRGATFVGPGTMQVGLVDSLRSGRPTVIRSGDNFVSLVHVEDMARAALLALTTPHDSATFNVCAPPLRQREYVAWLAEAWGTPPPVQRFDAPVPPSFRCTADRIRERLGWTPTVPIVRRP